MKMDPKMVLRTLSATLGGSVWYFSTIQSSYRNFSTLAVPPETQLEALAKKAPAVQYLQQGLTWMMNEMRQLPDGSNRTREPRPSVDIELKKLAKFNLPGRPVAIVDGSFQRHTTHNQAWAVIALNYNVPFFIAYGSELFGKQEFSEPKALLNALMSLAKTGYSGTGFRYLTDNSGMAKAINAIIREKGDQLNKMTFKELARDTHMLLAKYLYRTNSTIEFVDRKNLKLVDFPALYAAVKLASARSSLPYDRFYV